MTARRGCCETLLKAAALALPNCNTIHPARNLANILPECQLILRRTMHRVVSRVIPYEKRCHHLLASDRLIIIQFKRPLRAAFFLFFLLQKSTTELPTAAPR